MIGVESCICLASSTTYKGQDQNFTKLYSKPVAMFVNLVLLSTIVIIGDQRARARPAIPSERTSDLSPSSAAQQHGIPHDMEVGKQEQIGDRAWGLAAEVCGGEVRS